MNSKRYFQLLVAAAVLGISSCSEQSLKETIQQDQPTAGVTFQIDPFVPAMTDALSGTRTTVSPGNVYNVTWACGDVLGIFPEDGCQVPFKIADSQAGQASAQFDGGNWAIKDGIAYNAYYPFNRELGLEENVETHIPVTYAGQQQTGQTCGVGAYDYTYSDWNTANDGTVNFSFHHIGAIVELTLNLPATTTYTKMTLSTGSSIIPMTGYYDLTAAQPAFVADNGSKTSSLSVALNNFIGTAGQDAKVYFMMPPVDPTSTTMTVTLSTGYNSCTYSLTPAKLEAAKIARFTGTPVSSTIPGTIEEWGQTTPSADNPVSGLTSYSAQILCNCPVQGMTGVTEVGLFYSETETDPKSSNATKVTASLSNVDSDGNYTIELTDLKENTTYYYRSYYKKSGLTTNGTVKTFKTLQGQYYVTLETGSATGITGYHATVNATLTIGQSSMYKTLSYGICWGTSPNPTTQIQKTNKDANGNYSHTLTCLDRNTTYYYRPYAIMDQTLFYGPESSFTTSAAYVAQSSAASQITCYSAIVTSTLLAADYQEYGLCYGTGTAPTTKYQATGKDQSGQYQTTLTGLYGSTTYYYRPYAVIDGKTYYGQEQTLTTTPDDVVTTGTINETTRTVTCTLTIGDGAYSNLVPGVCWSGSSTPTVNDGTATTTEIDGDGNYSVTINGRSGLVYYRAYLLIDGVPHYGAIKSVTLSLPKNNGHEYVDLGLSVKWATMNVGATTETGYGDYFAWGATEPLYEHGYAQEDPQSHWKTGKSAGYTWVNTPYQTANTTDYYSTKWTKYVGSTTSSYKDASATDADALKTVLDASDDAATANWGGSWRMPTRAEQDELRNTDNCTWNWYSSGNTEFNGIAGYKVTSKKSGYAGNYIFLPAAGYRDGTYLDYVGSYGNYWSSSLDTSYPYYAYYLYFHSGYVSWFYYDYRFCGQSVRPVCH